MYAKYAQLRDAKGLTDYKISKDTGIPQSSFTDWRKGISEPKLEKIIKIAECLDVPVEVFVNAKKEEIK